MKKFSITLLIIWAVMMTAGNILMAQDNVVDDYKRAEQFLPSHIYKHLYRTRVSPHWANDGSAFWYRVNTRRGAEFIYVNSENEEKRPFFDQEKLASNLSDKLGHNVDPYKLPFNMLSWDSNKHTITFRADHRKWQADLQTLEIQQLKCEHSYESRNRRMSVSPDSQWVAFRRGYDLYIQNRSTGREFQLTHDGDKENVYAAYLPWAWKKEVGPQEKNAEPLPFNVSWSPDSKKLFTNELDLRLAKKMYLLQNVTDHSFRSEVYSYYRALPGDTSTARLRPYVFDVKNKTQTRLDIGPFNTITNGGNWRWIGDNSDDLYFIYRTRGYKSAALLKADVRTGKVQKLFKESRETYVDPLNFDVNFLPETNEVLWLSERDGWNHIFLYDLKTGQLKRQITKGNYVVKKIDYVDASKRKIYFTAGGRETGEDPYYNHFYSINFDGSGLILLNPEKATHQTSISQFKKYFVDTYSRVDQPPVSVLRRIKDGKIVMNLEEADIKDLKSMGWQAPEPFKLKARDGKTDIYGTIYRPSNFDPNKLYPVLDATYSGPQAVRTPKSFMRGVRNQDQPIAELGFIVITVDGLGTAQRSKAFHDFSYKNLGDNGAPDHIKAIRELAQKHDYMDTTRIGIYGHSAGGMTRLVQS